MIVIPKLIIPDDELDRIERSRLTDRQRKVFRWYYRKGWNIEKIAAELDVCRRTISYILEELRAKR